jgi:hypothetical protein
MIIYEAKFRYAANACKVKILGLRPLRDAHPHDTFISKILARLFTIVCKSKIKKLCEQRIVSS